MQAIKENENIISLKCDKCSEKEHEWFFCRCEMRNIAVAKYLRDQGEPPWIYKQPKVIK